MRRGAGLRPQRPLLILVLSMLLGAGWLLALPVRAAADGPTTFSNAASIAIPASGSADQIGPASPYPSNITVSGMAGVVTNVTVTFHGLTLGAAGDVDAMVVAPGGANLLVMSDVGPANSLTFTNNATLIFTDSATAQISAAGQIASGSYRPTNNSAPPVDSFRSPAPAPSNQSTLDGAFTGINPNGNWQLFVVDDTTGDVGSMAGGWSLSVTTETTAVATTTTVTSSDNTSFIGDPVVLTARVTAGGGAVSSGTVQFADGSTNLGGPVTVSSGGIATYTADSLTEGTHTIRATYTGVTGFLGSNGTVSQRVDNETVRTDNTFCNNGPITAPDSGPATPYPSNIFVTGLSGRITKVTANLRVLTHQASIDLDVLLAGPTPTTNVFLLSDAGGDNNPVSNANLIFDDAAAGPVASPMVSGTFRPTRVADESTDAMPAPAPTPSSATALSTFNGGSANGTWSLWVVDDASGDVGSVSGGWCLTITSQAPTETVVSATHNPSSFGQEVTFSATVNDSDDDPVTDGTVQFREGATVLGTEPVDDDGVASLDISTLSVGSHAITAEYSGTADLAESSDTLTQVVNRAASRTLLISSVNPSAVGESITFTATVTGGGSPLTAGSVQFAVDGADVGDPLPVSAQGQATYTNGALAAGTHDITATYGGSTNFGTSDDDLEQVVNKIATSTVLTSTPNPSRSGQLVTFSATVTASGSPASGGTVQFRDAGTALGGPVPLAADGTANLATADLDVGTHTITSAFSGTASLATSVSTDLGQVVDQARSTTIVNGMPNPSVFGTPVTLTAAVTSGGLPAAGGTVQFSEGGTPIGATVSLAPDGTASSTATLSAGTHTITATFSGTTEIAGSADTTDQVVERATTVTALSTAPDPSTFGQTVTLRALVTVGTALMTEGTVKFTDGDTVICEEREVQPDGTATCEADNLAVGTHTITATFSGTPDYKVSADSEDQVVNQASTTTTIAPSANPAAFGLPVTFTVSVTAGADVVTEGSVTVLVDGTVQQVATDLDSAGQVTFVTSTLPGGSHTIRAEYAGTTSYVASFGELQQQVEIAADAGGPYQIAEGDSVTLNASGSSPTGDFQWDLDDDGVFGDATGVNPTLSWPDLKPFGIDDGEATPTAYPIAVQIRSGSQTIVAAATITVTNSAPASILTGDLAATVGEPFRIKVGADDPSSADMAALFTYTVDWGDGSPVLTVDGPADPPVTHTYTGAGEYRATFTATDKDGGTGPGMRVVVLSSNASDDDDDSDADDTDDTDDSDSEASDSSDSGGLASTGSAVGMGAIVATLVLLGGGGALIVAGRRRSSRRPD